MRELIGLRWRMRTATWASTVGWSLLIAVAAASFLPAITIDGAPKRWIDPDWIEALATFWGLLFIGLQFRATRRQRMEDDAQAYVTWKLIEPEISTAENAHVRRPAIFVDNRNGRFPISDITIFRHDSNGRHSVNLSYPVPVPAGAEHQVWTVADSFNDGDYPSLAWNTFEMYFTTAIGSRYHRDKNGRLRLLRQ